MNEKQILVINPNPKNTMIAVYENNKVVFLKTARHKEGELAKFDELLDQEKWRTDIVLTELKENDIDLNKIDIIIARSGLIKPVESGAYEVNDAMIKDLKKGIIGHHAHNLGGLIARNLLTHLTNAKAYIADPIVVDEMQAVARISGNPMFERKSVFHALNQKTVARKYAKSVSKEYEDLNLVVVHIESGVSIGAHKAGRVIDVNQTFDGGGPFSFERAGTLPVGDLLRMAFSGKYSEKDLFKLINEESGLKAYLGVNSMAEMEDRVRGGDERAEFIMHAMAYQIAKSIGGKYAVLEGEVDAIILSGEPFHCKIFIDRISKHVHKIAPIAVYPNEDAMEAMAINGLAILRGEKEIKEYK
ncbi:MAG: butyrate kinase [Bacteroidales bacterium]|nr:butyrate kinase [Bacteroidales bacterium]